MMQVIVNGAPKTIAPAITVQQLLELLAIGKGRLAIEINGEIVPRSTFTDRVLHEGDSIEIVQAIGGG